jgi:hypothetical protein
MIKKFVIRKSKKFKFTKLPSQQTDRLQSLDKFRYDAKKKAIFTRRPDIGNMFKQEAAAKFARGVEASKLESGLKKVRKAAIKQFEGTTFFTKKYGSQKSKFVQKLSDEEARELGFPPREVFKSSKKTPMTDIDKSVSEYTTVEKLNPQTKKFETFRKFKLGGSGKAGTGFIDRRFVFYDKKLKGYRKKK